MSQLPSKFNNVAELEKFFTELGGSGISVSSNNVVVRILKNKTSRTVTYLRGKDGSLVIDGPVTPEKPKQERPQQKPQSQKPKTEEKPKSEEKTVETPKEPENPKEPN